MLSVVTGKSTRRPETSFKELHLIMTISSPLVQLRLGRRACGCYDLAQETANGGVLDMGWAKQVSHYFTRLVTIDKAP